MEPRIQYAQTEDGVSIAYCVMGEGEPAIVQCLGLGHTQAEWEFPERRAWAERLSRNHTFVRFDHRGCGLSDRDVSDVSVDAWVRDIEAVVEREGLTKVALFAPSGGVKTALAYAVKNADRVSQIILWHPRELAGADSDPVWRLLAKLRDLDWELYTDIVVLWAQGWSGGLASARFAELIRAASTPEMARAVAEAHTKHDLTPVLSKLQTPALLLFRPKTRLFSEDTVRAAAGSIPNSRLAFLEGDTFAWYFPDPELAAAAIEDFIGGDRRASPRETSRGAFRTILFTDVEGSTALTDRLGDAKARELLREHERITREALKAHGGAEVKTMGDGFMASFASATKALQCAISLQRAFEEHNASGDEPIRVRIGLNAGEPIAEDDPDGRSDLFGTAVNMAARIAAKADAGEILVADVVRQLVAGKEFLFADRGDTELRGFEDPVRVYEVRWRDDEVE